VDKDSRGAGGPGALRILRAIAALPGVVLGAVPGAIVALSGRPVLRPWPWPAVAALPFALGLALIPLVEEKRLLRRFGAEYERYREAVPRWLPRLGPWRGA
jgi:protein-S-isoprenylcysteine O-methyltransferase Ste14